MPAVKSDLGKEALMLELAFPETPAHELVFAREGVEKGIGPKVVTSRVLVGEPSAVTIDETTLGDDVDLKRFLADQKDLWSFHAVQLSCSFQAGDGEVFERALIGVTLSAQGAPTDRQPRAWSMAPTELVQKVEIKKSASISADLKLVKADLGTEKTYTDNELYLKAYDDTGSNPYWRLKAVLGITIEGAQQLRMIVRAPRDVPSVGLLDVRADIRTHRFLMQCQAPVPNIPQLSFSL
jgi:hypothetical protein